MGEVHVVDHPLVQAKLTRMRDTKTSFQEFRRLLHEIGLLMSFEVTRDLQTKSVHLQTPVCDGDFPVLADENITIVPILRAGLGMVDGLHELIPFARVGHIGLARNEQTHEPEEYYFKMPKGYEHSVVIVVDPMLATGGSAVDAISRLKRDGCTNIRMMNLIAAPEGVAAMQSAHPDVDVYVAAIDEKLNENAYIVPGLGDAGDRIFGTD